MILVTGGNGFIGKQVVNLLDSEKVISLDPTYSITQGHFIKGSTEDRELLEELFKKHNITSVIHLGMSSISKHVKNDIEAGRNSIVTGTENLLQVMKEFGCKRVLFTSTSMVYGDFKKTVVFEEDECAPIEPYGQLKFEAENLVKDFSKTYEMEYTIVRPTSVYGEGEEQGRVVSLLLNKASKKEPITIKGSNTLLDFTYVGEVAKAIVAIDKNKSIKNETFNIARGRERSLLDLANLICEHFPETELKVEERDTSLPKRGRLCVDKAKRLIGFNPTVELEEGIERIVKGGHL